MPRRERKKRRVEPKHRNHTMDDLYCICPECGTKKKTEVECHKVVCHGCGRDMIQSRKYRGGKYV